MNTHALAITGKQRPHPVAPVSLDDFRYQEGDEVDPAIVAQESNISLYCVDHPQRRAIFVETPPDLDLAAAPFLYQTQYDAAQRLIAVPYDVLDRIVDEVHIDARQLILVYSTGRCGSTLVSHALNQARGVVGFSEPDVYTQLTSCASPTAAMTPTYVACWGVAPQSSARRCELAARPRMHLSSGAGESILETSSKASFPRPTSSSCTGMR